MDSHNIEFHTYQLQNEKDLKIVLRGLHHQCDPQHIIDDLKDQVFNPTKITQMINKKKQQANGTIFNTPAPHGQKNI